MRKSKNCIHWFTGTTLPCLSNFKPYAFPIEGQEVLKSGPYLKRNSEWFWNKHTRFIESYKGYSMAPSKGNYIKTIKAIERKSIEDVNSLFLQENQKTDIDFAEEIKNGKLVFKALNTDEKENKHFLKEYNLFTKAVILSKISNGKEVRSKNLQKIWHLVRDEFKYKDYIVNEVTAFLKGKKS